MGCITWCVCVEMLLGCTLVYLSSGPLFQSFWVGFPHLFHLFLSASFSVLPLSDPFSFPFILLYRHILVRLYSFFVTYLSLRITLSLWPPCCWRNARTDARTHTASSLDNIQGLFFMIQQYNSTCCS